MTDRLDNNLGDWNDLATKDDWSAILVGNGFSQNIWRGFGYDSLFKTASQEGGGHLAPADVSLFDCLETRNFESVLSALAMSKAVALALKEPHVHFEERENSIRAALIQAVHRIHLPWHSTPDTKLDRIAEIITKYKDVYCTNYDLLIYWSLMRNKKEFKDYFWDEQFDITNTKIWGKESKIHFLHGGLHLYLRPNGQTLKRRAEPDQNLLDLFGTQYGDAVPLFISEGTYKEKVTSIYRSDYLSFVFACLKQDAGPLVVFGHSLNDSDKHIIDAVGSHQGRSIAVSVRAVGNIRQKKAAIIKALPGANIHFFDAATHPLGAADLLIEGPAE